MSFMAKIFNRQEPPSARTPGAEIKAFVDELTRIGSVSLMHRVYDQVDCLKARQLAAAWDEIGGWTA